MTRFGYHASHEQYTPSDLLECVILAEAAGFESASCSDHFHPWMGAQGQSGFAWSWLGSALQATALSLGTVNAPGARYHPAIIAQAAATLAEMFPGRFWFAIGSGEALNEAITGEPWPVKAERNARLEECAAVMRALWRGETVTHRGRVTVQEARLYTLPESTPPLFGAALSPETAAFVGGWADGLMTLGGPIEKVRTVIEAFREAGGEGKPVFVQHALSWARSEDEARRGAHEQWRFSALGGELLPALRTPAEFEAAARFVTPNDVARGVRVSADLARHTAWLQEYAELGVDALYLFNVNRNQREFIESFGEWVLPELERTPAATG
ncbi:MAG TPA: TIGR03885 family FMN-dependent LLM class oxidoreductase [Gemmatimonadaceae bacterium]|nr:TIGR03885 family FMN-dependent LLM class oxidoreductase [Gemmatimonadaceae bacterium]